MHELFARYRDALERAISAVALRARMTASDRDDFAQDARLLVLKHPEVLERYRGQSTADVYLATVFWHFLLNRRAVDWGRWRLSGQARALGPIAVRLQRCIERDHFSEGQAIERLTAEGAASREDLERVAAQLLPAHRRRALLVAMPGQIFVAAAESPIALQTVGARVATWLREALSMLRAPDRDLLCRRFCARESMAAIGASLGLTPEQVSRRVYQILAGLRASARARNVDPGTAGEIVDCRILADVSILGGDQTRPDQTRPDQTRPDRIRPKQNGTER